MIRILLSSYFLFLCLGIVSGQSLPKGDLVFVVERTVPIPPKQELAINLTWAEIESRNPAFKGHGVTVVEMHYGTQVASEIIDYSGDKKPDLLSIKFQFPTQEVLYTFSLSPSGSQKIVPGADGRNEGLKITYLSSSSQFAKKKGPVQSWPDRIFQSTMEFYPDPAKLSIHAPGKWSYEYGLFLNAAFELWQRTKKQEYLDYMKKWADYFVEDKGQMTVEQYDVSEYKLDDILPGRLLISLYTITKEEKYKIAAARFEDQLLHQPRTKDGGYWHKQIYPHQMWLDGILMADVFSTQYASVFNNPKGFDDAIQQIKIIAAHTTDPKTGLMYHGWDESINKVWAHPERGTSPEFWSRAIGWYMMALVQCLDYIPENHPERKDVISILQKLSASVLRYQDEKSGVWFQVIDKASTPGNWVETSASAMFAYTFAKGARQGHLDKSYAAAAKKAFDALVGNYVYFDDSGRLYLDQTVRVGTLNFKTSNGSYEYYIGEERRINDYKGLGALFYASLEIK